MVDPACSQLYHVAFQNTIKKAMFFIDRQLQDRTALNKLNFPDQHLLITHTNDEGQVTAANGPPTSSSRLLPTQYYAFLASEPKKLLHQKSIQRLWKIDPIKPRPMPIPRAPTPPPLYCSVTTEDTYTRATNRHSMILPREEEGCEALPPYHCSVYKMAELCIKIERAGKKIHRRSWRRVYIELWGTVLRIYPLTWFWATVASEPTYTISLAGAEASRAVDYIKRPWILRLVAHNGMKLLIQASNHDDMMSWIEHLQSGINISLDLEERPMPKFLTLPPRRGLDTGVLCARMAELEQRRELRRRTQQEILA